MDHFTEKLHAHMAKLLTYEAMPAPQEAHIAGSIEYHRDSIRHMERMADRPLPTVDHPHEE